ncbi:hypothetical protein E1B28_002517 [Marasmius oreades]|uniref:N-acetyltransferase ECO1 n=1 Tax=Marasmius oreades TaxID=181124 RepID=A0A9P7ULU7_9AGAR|nr:uncharacterized protein E1B28_002517 [Marasmius oreades]KAG7086570.1 hypothetical protein E1B28_002517 [Marasmius oreades]
MSSQVKRTYGSRPKTIFPPSSPISVASSSPPPAPMKRSLLFVPNSRPTKRIKLSKPKQKTLVQLHFCIDKSTLQKCSKCDMSYTKGVEEDEALHRTHCLKVKKGMEWGREEEKEEVLEVESMALLKSGKKGRIVCVRADATGKIGAKLNTIYNMMDTALSAPPLSPAILNKSKVYLFLLPASTSKERIAGCVVGQQITTAMEVAPLADSTGSDDTKEEPRSPVVLIDSSSGVFCYPKPLPTSLGIPRIFVPSTDRRQGIASKLLSAAAATFIHGCRLDPKQGHVAFSQTTGDGLVLMREWGGGGVRIYDED